MLCPSCATENHDGAKFCNECGTPLTAPSADPGSERKVVSVLFCDLVGFTSRSESADPEDVLATVRPYHSLLRSEIEAYGGTVEKFIGDAVMAVFGAPVAHEDDAERAVRAGLRIIESLGDLNEERGLDLSVRVGINTGEAVVSLGARPEQGEGMVTGDVVNTAARIQTGAPVGGVAVGESTYQATRDVFEYGSLEPISAKGKSEPVRAWRALASRARFGTDLTRSHTSQLVGRDVELTLLRNLFERAVRDRSCQLVTILGEPGVGKSRMVAELFTHIDSERDELITWRQGRCLPYGDGIAFWALGEIVKAHAGILESDTIDAAGDKLERALRATPALQEGEHEWLLARLAPLVGAETTGTAEQDESFAAWRRFLETMPGSDPVVYVFEDLHWADPAMLAFIEHLADWAEGIPMLLVGTARPELAEAHPGWGSGLRNSTTMNLAPLSEQETAKLIGDLLGQAVLPAEVQAPILERAGGNPLYAEEFVRMLKDRSLLEQHGRSIRLADAAEIPFPEGVHALIAARLDTLTPARKALLQDAAVVGKIFWAGTLGAMGGRDGSEVRDDLHELTRKEFVRAARQPTMEGEQEYAFWHMLVRDVAYAQIPRSARASKHLAAANWIEERAGERVEDLADVLAHHYAEALDLAEASGGETAEIVDRALRYLVLAGDRAADLDPVRAEVSYDRALALAPDGHPSRPVVLLALSKIAFQTSRMAQARSLLEEAIRGFAAAGDAAREASAKVQLYLVTRTDEATAATVRILDEAIATLEALPPGKELVDAYAMRATWGYVADIHEEVFHWAAKALDLCEQLGLPPNATALRSRGGVRAFTGDLDGIEELHRSVDLAMQAGLMREAVVGHNELANALASSLGPVAALAEIEAGLALARRCGLREMELFMEASGQLELWFLLGEWDQAERSSAAILAPDRIDVDGQSRTFCRIIRGGVAVWRGDLAVADDVARGLGDQARRTGEAQMIVAALDLSAHLALASGAVEDARDRLRELESAPNVRDAWNYFQYLPEITRIACACGDLELAERFMVGLQESAMPSSAVSTTMALAQLAEARGAFAEAADLYGSAEVGWRTFSVPERAQALLGRGRCLLEVGDPAAAAALHEGRALFASLRADRFLPEVDALLERSLRRSS